jgi:hypothetical protein
MPFYLDGIKLWEGYKKLWKTVTNFLITRIFCFVANLVFVQLGSNTQICVTLVNTASDHI